MTKPNPYAICRNCGARFFKPHKRAVFCTTICCVQHKVDIRGAGECWPWTGAKKENGYGSFSWAGKAGRYPHRTVLEWKLGRGLNPNEDTRHKCDNRLCCNPAHLQPGSRGDNMKDCRDRGRFKPPPHHRGEDCHKAILTEADVLQIRSKTHHPAELPALAARYGVAVSTMRKVLRRDTWKHL